MFWELPSTPQQSRLIPDRSKERGALVRWVRHSQRSCLYTALSAQSRLKRAVWIHSGVLQRHLGENLSLWKLRSDPLKLNIKDQVAWSSPGFPHYPWNAGNWGKQNEKKKDFLNNGSLKLINAQKVVWRWKALLLSVINSGVTLLLIINNNNATEHATCKDLKILLKYESPIYSDILNGRNEAWRDATTCSSKALNT